MTAPWDARAIDDTLDSALTCVVELYLEHPTLGQVPLKLEHATLSYDETRVPFVVLDAASVEATPEALAAFDETAPVRVRIRVGYVYPGRVRDVHTIARLLVDLATVERPAGRVVFTAYSDEALMMTAPWTVPAAWDSATRFGPAFRSLIAATAGTAAADAAVIDGTLSVATILDAGDVLAVQHDDNLPAILRDLADRAGAFAYHDGLDTWRAEPAWLDTTPVAAITPGDRGLARTTQQQRERGEWGNAQVIVYRWQDDAGAERVVVGRAEILSGTYAVPTIGRKTRPVLTRGFAVSQSGANAAASAVLRRALSRRRLVAVEAARALWWIRPRDSITVATPDTPAQREVVSSVTFDLPAATMQIKTRTPEE